MCLSLTRDKNTCEAILNSDFEILQMHSDICFVNYIPHMVYKSNWIEKCVDSQNRGRVKEHFLKALNGPDDKPHLLKTDLRCPEGKHKYVTLIVKPCKRESGVFLHLKAREHFLHY